MEKDVDVAVAAGLDSEPLLKVPWAKVREVLAKVPWTKLGISVTVIALIVLVLQKRIELQNAVVALVVVAALPWLGAVLNEVEFGGTTIKFREIREKVDEQGKLLHDLSEIRDGSEYFQPPSRNRLLQRVQI